MTRRALLLVPLLAINAALVAFAACDPAPPCPAVQASCNGACTNLQNDPLNCGGCGNACKPAELCSHGKCASVCGKGEQACTVDGGAYCADLQTENQNCGACGKACPTLQKCKAGACSSGCSAGQTACAPPEGGAPYCANVQSDGLNCGACGKSCGPLELCGNGACVTSCASGQAACIDGGGPGYCANTQTDNANCGSCGFACDVLQTCTNGSCVGACVAGQTLCVPDAGTLPDGAPLPPFCTNTQTDNANCGACGYACPYPTPLCVASACVSLEAGSD